jgi:hypothetical protein
MRFELTQRYASQAPDVTAAYADPELYPTLVGLPKLGGIEVISHLRTGSTARLQIRFRFIGDLPGAVTAVVDPDRLTWVQHSVHDLDTGAATFTLVPDHYADRLEAHGRFDVIGDVSGTTRRVTGDLKVRALLVGHKVEQAIVSGLDEYLHSEAPAVDAYLDASR